MKKYSILLSIFIPLYSEQTIPFPILDPCYIGTSKTIQLKNDRTEITFSREKSEITFTHHEDKEHRALMESWYTLTNYLRTKNVENGNLHTEKSIVFENNNMSTQKEFLSIKSTTRITHLSKHMLAFLKAQKGIQLSAPFIHLSNVIIPPQNTLHIINPSNHQSLFFIFNEDKPSAITINLDLTQKVPAGTVSITGGKVMTICVGDEPQKK